MMIKEGYKETEIGLIPEEWEVKELKEVAVFIRDGSHGSHKDIEDGIPLLSAKDIMFNKIQIPNDCRRISLEDYTKLHKNYELQIGDVLLTIVGTIGRTAIVESVQQKYTFQRSVAVIRPNDKVQSNYMRQYFDGTLFQNQLRNSVNASAQGGVYLKTLNSLCIIIPLQQEQQRIAEILSTTDEHIEKLDKIIEDYQLLKKGMMKKLLTEGIGHTEFKDTEIGRIPKEWEVNKIDNCVTKIHGGGTPSRSNMEYYSGNIPWITVKDLDDKFYKHEASEYITEEAVKNSATNLIQENSIIIATRMGLGRGFINTRPVAINQDMKALILKKDIDNKYFLYWYLSKTNMIESLGTGTTVKGIRLETLKEFKLPIPPLTEQQHIAEILSTTNEHIEKLDKIIEDYQLLKKALMEQLLTGKIRVKQ